MANNFYSFKAAEKYEGYPDSLCEANWDWKSLNPVFSSLHHEEYVMKDTKTNEGMFRTLAFYFKGHLWTLTYSHTSNVLSFEYKETDGLTVGAMENVKQMKEAIKLDIADGDGFLEMVKIWEMKPSDWRRFKVHFFWGNEVKHSNE